MSALLDEELYNINARIKDAEDSKLSDETYKGMVENAEGQLEEKVKYYDIYYNKKALNPENKFNKYFIFFILL
mgnify:CR=1 FL=1